MNLELRRVASAERHVERAVDRHLPRDGAGEPPTSRGDALLSTKEKPKIIVEKITEREEKLTELQARIASMKTAPQVLDLEARRMEKEARERIADLRAVMSRKPEEAKQVLAALLDGKLTFTPIETKEGRRYAISGKIATGALLHRMESVGQVHEPERPQGGARVGELGGVHQVERPQGDSNPR
jgi:DNA repair exonuclease SbcCD ATPase subunit